MGCTVSREEVTGHAINRSTTVSPARRDRNVSFAVGSRFADEPSTGKRDSLKSLDSIDSVTLLSMIGAHHDDYEYPSFATSESKRVIAVVRCALEINHLEWAKQHSEAMARYEAVEAALPAEPPQQSSPIRGRRARTTQNGDRPTTPVGYETEEPSASAIAIRRAATGAMKKIANFFGDDEAGSPMTPSVKYFSRDDEASDRGSMYPASSMFGASVNGSMRSGSIQLSTAYAQLAEGEELIVIDEKAVQRARDWAADQIGVVLRVLEIHRRRLRIVEGESVASESVSHACAVAAGATDGSSSSAPQLKEVSVLFPLTLSPDPLADEDKISRSGSLQSKDCDEKESSRRTDESSTNGSLGGGPQLTFAGRRQVGNINRGDTHLCKRNLDKLQERLTRPLQSLSEEPQVEVIPRDDLEKELW